VLYITTTFLFFPLKTNKQHYIASLHPFHYQIHTSFSSSYSRAMAKKRKSIATTLDEVDRTMYASFCSAANSLSQLHMQALNHQKLSFQAGQRHGLVIHFFFFFITLLLSCLCCFLIYVLLEFTYLSFSQFL